MSPPPSTRWCPTPEQLMILEELYKRGLRTPNASQIQKITAHLAYYGKIQGKNVFYWFQNHKARDRQKLRKKLLHQQLQHQHHHHLLHNYQITPHQPFLPPPPPSPPPHFQFQCPNFYSPQDLHAQGIPICEEAPEAAMKQAAWSFSSSSSSDVPKDWPTRWSTHDMPMDMEPSSPGGSRPLETLQLFPLTPQKTPSSLVP